MNDVKRAKQHINTTKIKYTVPKETWSRLMKPVVDDCPVCGAKDQQTDILAHGPGIAVLGYECGCSVSSKEGRRTAYRKYDGTVTYGETDD